MKIYLASIFIFAFLVIVFLGDVHEIRHQAYMKELRENQVVIPEVIVPNNLLENSVQRGSVVLIGDSRKISQSNLDSMAGKQKYANWNSVVFRTVDDQSSMWAAKAVDEKFYFANSYLIGFKPFDTENNWLPLYTLAQRKQYQMDLVQYGIDEIWQNSAQSYVNLRGDCEDHAILLADWLIESGLDARVVLGRYQGGGHAWVIAFVEGKPFLLEATSKRKQKSWKHYPLAFLSTDYEPEYMFNRQTFWANKGTLKTTDYQGSHWIETATFKFDEIAASVH